MSTAERGRSGISGTGALPLVAGLAVLLFSGCGTVQSEARFADAREAASSRLNQNLVWNRNSEQDHLVKEAVQRLLQQELTADAAVQIALLSNRDLQAMYARLGIAQADLVEAGLLQNPVFSLSAVKGNGASIIEASVVQDFVGIFSLSARKKIGEAAAQRVTFEVAQRAVELANQVQADYYTVVGDEQALELDHQVVAATEAAAELAERQRQVGNLSRRDQNVHQAFYAQTLLEVAQAETQLASDRERLTRLMGLWGADAAWKSAQRLPNVPDRLPSLDQMEAKAVAQRLDLIAARKDAEVTAQALNLTRQFRYLSPFGIGIAYKREPDIGVMVGPTIEIGLPLFDRGQARVARAESELKRSQETVAAVAVNIRSEAREGTAKLIASRDVVSHYEKALLPLQESIVSDTLKLYNGMLVGVYDLLLAKQNQIQTARQYITAIKQFWLAFTDLERAVGGRVPLPAVSAASPKPAEGGMDHQHLDHKGDH